jgi:hypothetical protein
VVLVTDILSTLNAYDQALGPDELARVLGVDPDDVDQPLRIGVAQGLIQAGSGEWVAEPASAVDLFTITQAGRERYAQILDRFAQQVAGPPGLSIPERFIIAVSETRPDPLRRALDELAEDPALAFVGEARERERAQRLAAAAIGRWAQAALDSREGVASPAAGLRSLALGDLEAIGYAAGIVRAQYAPAVDGEIRQVLLAAADAGESASELRHLGPRGENDVSLPRPFEPSAARELAEHAAVVLIRAADAGMVDLFAEAKLIAEATRWPG